ncbi:hypothetical protein [Lichenifustis flavocetrariae]|uniref:Uncharacterized protein n=1 Tax=Lichenifustis flavocetrariae TaxID=2949735 RepID=A0AA42CML1_9HYPH|nr:hypothetical protein [Lichenifustis flavocetrariae]MCW6512799.1 hypothetical protein [Lichenifustis flavocetrariae]
MSAIEALERLNRRTPRLASPIRARVLRGEIGHRELLEIERGAVISDDAPAGLDWSEFGKRLYLFFFVNDGNGDGWMASNAEKTGYSEIAKLLKVDIEAETARGRAAMYLSPIFPFSEGRGRALDDHLARAFAALCFFDRVIFIVADDRERGQVEHYVRHALRTERFERFATYKIDDVPEI